MGRGCNGLGHAWGRTVVTLVGSASLSYPFAAAKSKRAARFAVTCRGTIKPDLNNFQRRFGFAYQTDSKTVVRGGWAIYAPSTV